MNCGAFESSLSVARIFDADFQHAVGDGCLWPDSFYQFVFCHETTRIADEIEQDGEFFGRDGDGLVITPQALVDEVETEFSEEDLLF